MNESKLNVYTYVNSLDECLGQHGRMTDHDAVESFERHETNSNASTEAIASTRSVFLHFYTDNMADVPNSAKSVVSILLTDGFDELEKSK